jgi:hypothetical protein
MASRAASTGISGRYERDRVAAAVAGLAPPAAADAARSAAAGTPRHDPPLAPRSRCAPSRRRVSARAARPAPHHALDPGAGPASGEREPSWGYRRIHGELLVLGVKVARRRSGRSCARQASIPRPTGRPRLDELSCAMRCWLPTSSKPSRYRHTHVHPYRDRHPAAPPGGAAVSGWRTVSATRCCRPDPGTRRRDRRQARSRCHPRPARYREDFPKRFACLESSASM